MGFTSAWHWILVLVVILIVFGAGKLPRVMGDLAKGIKNFKAGMKDDDVTTTDTIAPSTTTTHTTATTTPAGEPHRTV
jgi:TatA/E family protein of Tat protein translocase